LLPLLQARIADIWAILGEYVAELAVVRVDYHAFKLKVILTDGSSLRINEQYRQGVVEQYACYWLAPDGQLRVGWDNAPPHRDLDTFLITSMQVRRGNANHLLSPPQQRSSLPSGTP
jgi:hypothetical protein